MKILIISRKAKEQRRQFQSRQMQKLGLAFEFSRCEDWQGSKHLAEPNTTRGCRLLTSHRLAQKIVERNERALRLATCGPDRIPAISLIRAIPHRANFPARPVARVRAFPLLRLIEFPELSLGRCHYMRDGLNGAGKLVLNQAPMGRIAFAGSMIGRNGLSNGD